MLGCKTLAGLSAKDKQQCTWRAVDGAPLQPAQQQSQRHLHQQVLVPILALCRLLACSTSSSYCMLLQIKPHRTVLYKP